MMRVVNLYMFDEFVDLADVKIGLTSCDMNLTLHKYSRYVLFEIKLNDTKRHINNKNTNFSLVKLI